MGVQQKSQTNLSGNDENNIPLRICKCRVECEVTYIRKGLGTSGRSTYYPRSRIGQDENDLDRLNDE